ncbi:MAG: GatB/YqeY domain-containing protein [Candidatus Saccharibacteria bacterium]
MTISEQLVADITASMKAGDSSRTSTLRLLKNAIKNEEIRTRQDVTNEDMMKILMREAKQRRDSIAAYEEAGRTELVAEEKAELEIIATYLPQPLSEDELNVIVAASIARLGATDIKLMGAVIADVMKESAGKAEGAEVSRLVKAALL